MKMAKPSERDIDAAGDLIALLHQLDRGDYPNIDENADVPDWFDVDNPEHLRAFYDAVKATLDKGPGYPGRVIGGMCYVIMFDKNEIVDPDSDTLDLHPKIVKALEAVDAQAAAVRAAYENALQFTDHIINGVFEGGDWNGGEVQELAVKYGLLKLQTMAEPCGEDGSCQCAQNVPFFPAECFRKTYVGALATKEAAAIEAPSQAAMDVLAERRRQVEAEGWTLEGDDQYDGGELSLAAACYALAGDPPYARVPADWPWDYDWWKPTDDRRNLVKAAALLLADIERLDRTPSTSQTSEGESA